MTYEHMHAAEQRENAKLHDRVAELEAEVASLRAELTGTAGAAAHTMNDLLIRAEAAEAAWNTTETALRTLIDECTNETGEWSRMPRFWVIKKARAALKEDV